MGHTHAIRIALCACGRNGVPVVPTSPYSPPRLEIFGGGAAAGGGWKIFWNVICWAPRKNSPRRICSFARCEDVGSGRTSAPRPATERSREVESWCFDVCSSGEVEQRNRPRGSHAGYRYACTVCARISVNNYFFKPRPNRDRGYKRAPARSVA